MLHILVLGAAAGGGFPQWNSNSAACRRARVGTARQATQSSVAVSCDGATWYLLNASPDLRQQINERPQLHPRFGRRHSPIAGVVLTNADVDHVAGLLCLRESHPFSLYATTRVHAALRANPIFGVLSPACVTRHELAPGEPFRPVTGLEIEAFAVPGKVPLYLEDPQAGPGLGTADGDTIGLRIADAASGRHFFYIPGCAAMTDALADRLYGAPLVFFDGTLYRDDEMIRAGEGAKTGRRMGHMSMSGPDGVVAAFAPLGVRRRIFIHINNTNPTLLDDTPERREIEAAGWEIAYDGMEAIL